MPNIESSTFEEYSLPPDHQIRLAQKRDYYDILKYERSLYRKYIYYFWIAIYPISIILTLPAGYSAWERWHRSIVFESGIELLTTPDLTGWLYIIQQSARFALLFPTICLLSFILVSIIFRRYGRQLAKSNSEEIIPDLWIIKHRKKIIGEAIFRENKSYVLLRGMSMHPKYRNCGLGSYLLWIALKNIQKPVYLFCRPKMQNFYRRIGFVSLPWRQIPILLKPVPWYKVMKIRK